MPQKIIIIRHGETDYNKERRMQGWLDIPLNAEGHAQAKQAAVLLAQYKVDALYSSDLTRAHQTTIHKKHQNQNIVVVTHGGTINRILEHYGIKDAKEGYRTVTNASLTILVKQSTGYILKEL
jgi:broad specificity phosphatase PhoE